jgi:hypothetical protein
VRAFASATNQTSSRKDLAPRPALRARESLEREADRAAAAAVRGQRVPSLSRTSFGSSVVQSKCAACDQGNEPCSGCAVQGKADGGAGIPDVAPRIEATRGGAPLSPELRRSFEPRFGFEFGRVRVHADGEADALSRSLGARAFTYGNDIFFRGGPLDTASARGRRLIAHELAHVVQQSSSTPGIQRQTDAEFEAAQGLDTSIADGRMVRDPGVDRQTFVASNLGGIAGCSVTFRIRRAFVGTYNIGNDAAQGVRGVYISVSATQSDACGPAARTELVQVGRETQEVGGTLETQEPSSQFRADRAGWADPAARSRGWYVDTSETATSPFASSGVFSGHGGNAARPATMHDDPGEWLATRDRGADFHTCFMSYPTARSAGIAMACLHWGYYIDAAGNIAFRPNPPVAINGPTQAANDATLRFGRMAGNRPARVDFRLRPTGAAP